MKTLRHFFLLIAFVCLSSAANATEITIQSIQLPNFRFSGASPNIKLRIFLEKGFVTSDGIPLQPSGPSSGRWYKEVGCTLVGSTLTIPLFTIDSTTDGLDIGTATYTARFFNGNTDLGPFVGFENFRVPKVIASTSGCAPTGLCATWADLRQYNFARVAPIFNDFYIKSEVDAKIAAIGSSAPQTASYVTRVPEAGLTNEFALSTLGTGLLRHLGGGDLGVAVAGTDYELPLIFNAPLARSTNTISLNLLTNLHIDPAAAIAWTKISKSGASLADLPTRLYSDLQSIPSTFTPSTHASSHQHGGSDEVATATPGANLIVKAGAGGTIADGWLSSNVSLLGQSIDLSGAEATGILAAARFPSLAGDLTNSAGSVNISLANILTAGGCTNCDLTIDAKGRITAFANGSAGGGGGYTTIQEEGANLTQRATLNFVGGGITAADDAGNSRTNVTLNALLSSIAGLGSNGFLVRTGAGIAAARSLSAGTGIDITNPDGVSGNPSLSVLEDTTVQRIAARKNSTGGDVGPRRRINFIEGSNVTITLADDSTDNELDVTIDATGGGGGAPTDAQYILLALDGALTNERRFVSGEGLSATDGGANGDYTLALNLAGLVSNQTLWDGSQATRTLTANVSGTDPAITFGTGTINVSTGALQVAGSNVATGTNALTLENKIFGANNSVTSPIAWGSQIQSIPVVDSGGSVIHVKSNVGGSPCACDGTTDDTTALQDKIDALGVGDTLDLRGCDDLRISSTITIGNGSGNYGTGSATASTITDITVIGGGTKISWFGSSGQTMISVNGPINRLRMYDLRFDARSLAGIALDLNHPQESEFKNLHVLNNTDWAIQQRAYANPTGTANGSNNNIFDNIWISTTATGGKGFTIGHSSTVASPFLDVAQNVYRNLRIRFDTGEGSFLSGSIGVRLQFCDYLTFTGLLTAAATGVQVVVPSGTLGSGFPSSIHFEHPALAGTTNFAVSGSWTANHKFTFDSYHVGDGVVIPSDVTNTLGYDTRGNLWGNWTYLQQSALTSSAATTLTLNHRSTGTPGVGFGSFLLWKLESDTTVDRDAAALNVFWSNPTDAVRTANMSVLLSSSGTLAEVARYSPARTLFFGNTVERWRVEAGGWFIGKELTTDPTATELAAGDQIGIYKKNDKLVFAYNNAGTITYLTIPLNGSTTTWTQSTTAP